MDKIEISRTGGVSVITLKTDEANRFDPDSFALFDKLLAEEAAKADVRALILRSGVAGVFSQGLNLERLQSMTDAAAIERFLCCVFLYSRKSLSVPGARRCRGGRACHGLRRNARACL